MRGLVTILVIVLLIGCSPSRRFTRLILHHPELLQQHDSVRTWVSYTCDSFPIFLQGDILSFDTMTSIPADILINHTEKKGRLTSTLTIKNGRVSVECKEDSLRRYIEWMRKIEHERQIKTTSFTEYKFQEHWYLKPLIWWFIISLMAICVWLGVKYLKV